MYFQMPKVTVPQFRQSANQNNGTYFVSETFKCLPMKISITYRHVITSITSDS